MTNTKSVYDETVKRPIARNRAARRGRRAGQFLPNARLQELRRFAFGYSSGEAEVGPALAIHTYRTPQRIDAEVLESAAGAAEPR
jgi:hypothetical protein